MWGAEAVGRGHWQATSTGQEPLCSASKTEKALFAQNGKVFRACMRPMKGTNTKMMENHSAFNELGLFGSAKKI